MKSCEKVVQGTCPLNSSFFLWICDVSSGCSFLQQERPFLLSLRSKDHQVQKVISADFNNLRLSGLSLYRELNQVRASGCKLGQIINRAPRETTQTTKITGKSPSHSRISKKTSKNHHALPSNPPPPKKKKTSFLFPAQRQNNKQTETGHFQVHGTMPMSSGQS